MTGERRLPIENLPDEIWLNIFCQMIKTNPDTDPYAYMFDSVTSGLCLVNRHWNTFYTPLLYPNVSFVYHLKQTKLMWRFICTIVARPDWRNKFINFVILVPLRIAKPSSQVYKALSESPSSEHEYYRRYGSDGILFWASYGIGHLDCLRALGFQELLQLSTEPATKPCTNIGLDRPYYRLPKLTTSVSGSASAALGRKRRIPIQYNSRILDLCPTVDELDFDWSNLLGAMTNLSQLSLCFGINWARNGSDGDIAAASNDSGFDDDSVGIDNDKLDNDAVVVRIDDDDTGKTTT
ncbi:hypothetical protein BDW69DRAFT_181422 [Aspergillus filifer]